MTLLNDLHTQADQATQAYQADVQKLTRPDGSRRYSDLEHTERERASRDKAASALTALITEADQRIDAAQAAVARLQSDHTAYMQPDELAAAAARRSFVQEEAQLLSRCRQALSANDRVSLFLNNFKYLVELIDPDDRPERDRVAKLTKGTGEYVGLFAVPRLQDWQTYVREDDPGTWTTSPLARRLMRPTARSSSRMSWAPPDKSPPTVRGAAGRRADGRRAEDGRYAAHHWRSGPRQPAG